MTTCVIGGTGTIGIHVVDALLSKRRKVVVVGRRDREAITLPSSVNYISHDYSDTQFLVELLKRADEVIFLAYTTNPKTSYDSPMADLTTNLLPMVNFFRVASQTKLKKIVIVSTGGALYGQVSKNDLPIKENHQTNPLSPYGITKLAIEKYALMYHHISKLPIVIVRPGNSYGPRQKPFSGQGFIATAIASILSKKPVTIFGKKGTIRDYVYVTDIAAGIVAAMERGRNGTCYNLGSGIGRDNREVLQKISALAHKSGFKVKADTQPARSFDVNASVLDSTKLKRDTSWEIKTSFSDGVKLTWNWFVNNFAHWL